MDVRPSVRSVRRLFADESSYPLSLPIRLLLADDDSVRRCRLDCTVRGSSSAAVATAASQGPPLHAAMLVVRYATPPLRRNVRRRRPLHLANRFDKFRSLQSRLSDTTNVSHPKVTHVASAGYIVRPQLAGADSRIRHQILDAVVTKSHGRIRKIYLSEKNRSRLINLQCYQNCVAISLKYENNY